MYNGIGLTSVRGTGTSGYVQTNKFNLRGPPQQRRDRDEKGPSKRGPNAAILEHNRKREIEVKVEELRDQLEEEGLSEAEIEEKLAAYRAELTAKAEEEAERSAAVDRNKAKEQETHQMAARKMEQMDKLRNAFGFTEDIREGEAFDREIQEQKRLQKIAEREAKEAERRREREERERRREKEEKRRKKEEKKRRREEEEEQRRLEKERRREKKRFKEDERYIKLGRKEEVDASPGRYDGEEEEGEKREAAKPLGAAEDGQVIVEPATAVAVDGADEGQDKEIARQKSPSASPPRRKRHDSDSDRSPSRSASPPRRKSGSSKRDRSSSKGRGRNRSKSRSPGRRKSRRTRSPSYSTSSSSGTSSGSATSSGTSSDSGRSRSRSRSRGRGGRRRR